MNASSRARQPAAGTRRPADSAGRAYSAIRGLVVEFRLKPDARINEFQLARELGLSRTPVREALNRLASEGFLTLSPNRGFFFRSLYETRAVLERGAFELACQRASPAQMDDLDTFWTRALRVYRRREVDQMLELDEEFHLRLARMAGNEELLRQLAGINARIRFARRIVIERGPLHAKMIDEHTQLIAALRARQAAKGRRILSAHISLSIEDARTAMKEVLFNLYDNSAGSE